MQTNRQVQYGWLYEIRVSLLLFFVFVFDLVFLTGYVPKSWGRLTLAICSAVVAASDEKFRLFFRI